MKIYGELIKARLQQISGIVATAARGLIYYNTDNEKPYIDDGTASREILLRWILSNNTDQHITAAEGGTGKDAADIGHASVNVGDTLVVNAGKTGFDFGAGGGGGASLEIDASEIGNTFALLDPVYWDGSNWRDARADDGAKLASYVVTSVGAPAFKVSKFGEFTMAAHGKSPNGDYFFLGDTGGSETFEGTNYSQPLYQVIDANTIHVNVYRPSITATTGGATTYNFTVGNASDVANGSASFDSITSALAVASAGNIITLLPRTFVENVTVSDKVYIVGYGNESVIQGTLDFNAGSDGVKMESIKINGDVTVNTNNGIYTSSWLSTGSTFTDNGTNNVVRDIIIEV